MPYVPEITSIARERSKRDAVEILREFSTSQLHAMALGHYGVKIARLALHVIAIEDVVKAYEDEEAAHANDANDADKSAADERIELLEALLDRARDIIIEHVPSHVCSDLLEDVNEEIGP